ncbi:hypothetical protein IFT48_03255 [Pseudomonas fluorescens]|uniref:hypothetical protein n=1 Tax=Pseudomonas TaxID=286 RepID=UPI000F01CE04|nr:MULTISPECIES: hypothetical protein [Pseudomonas]MBD8088986.1 hypothetical protein [Pseudomonas fluorescens]MBD8615583.1 hypothetical protein [Pseudomonas putida]MBD8681765.1 hypothetical protein [Pseudomonas sp. CFBP 13719]
MSTIPEHVLNDPSLFYTWLIESKSWVKISVENLKPFDLEGIVVSKAQGEIVLARGLNSQHQMVVQEQCILTVTVRGR